MLKADYVFLNHSFHPDVNPPVSCGVPCSSMLCAPGSRVWRGSGGRLSGLLLDLTLLRKGQAWGSSPAELHHIPHVESQEAWPGSGLDVPAEDNSIQCSMARPGKLFLAGTAWKWSSGPFQQALIGEASLIVRNTFSCCLMVSLCSRQFF